MKPVYQTIFDKPHGNCLQACVASILELDLDQVPNFVENDDWFQALETFLERFDLQPAQLDPTKTEKIWKPTGFHIKGGLGPRKLHHAVVGLAGKTVHDPHPDGGGLVLLEDWIVFVATMTHGKVEP